MSSKQTLIENEYACMWYYPNEGIIHHQFLQPIAGKEFQGVLLTGLRVMQEHGAQRWLSDDRLNSILSAEDSAWSQDFWLPQAAQAGWKYWALLPPNKSRGQINMQRLTDYIVERYKVNLQTFTDPDRAWQWLAHQGKDA